MGSAMPVLRIAMELPRIGDNAWDVGGRRGQTRFLVFPCSPPVGLVGWEACHDDYASSTTARSTTSWPAAMRGSTSPAMTTITAGSRPTSAAP
jgi:hypothetical protein